MVNWYHRHLQNVTRVQGSLNKLCSPTAEWKWSQKEEDAFCQIKQALVNAKTLAIPRIDLAYFLHTDASDSGLGAFLVQQDPSLGLEYLITCLSRPLRGAETRYTTTGKECLAVVWAVRKLRCYLEGAPFTVITDHSSLRWLHSLKDPNGRLARWAMELLSQQITIVHRKGTEHDGPDALSRMYEDNNPIPRTEVVDNLNSGSSKCINIRSRDWYEVHKANVLNRPGNFPGWRIVDDRLQYYRPDPVKNLIGDKDAWKSVVKESEVQEILRRNHEDPDAAHLGRDRMYYRIGIKYYWPGMYRDVNDYVDNCELCKKIKSKNTSS